MRRFRNFMSVVLAGLVISWAGPSFAAKRVALVIGNDSYQSLPSLNNAGKDARDIAAKLEGLGFEVILKTNAGRRDFARALARFEEKLQGADAGLVFYAGHGIQADGLNYLVPSDARIEVEEDLRFEGIAAAEFLKSMARADAPVNLVILDACRDNPLPRRTRSAARGLSVVEVPSTIKGTAILYSAGKGEVAADGPRGGNGVFTGALLAALDNPGLTVEQVFKETARSVSSLTGGRQTPWNNSSLTGDFYFNSATPPTPKKTTAAVLPEDDRLWKSVENSSNPAMFRVYLKRFPNGLYADVARIKIEELEPKQTASLPPKRETVAVVPHRPVREIFTKSELAGTKWKEICNGSDVPVAYIKLLADGHFRFSYPGTDLKNGDSNETWHIENEELVIKWNDGYQTNHYSINKADRLPGRSSSSNCSNTIHLVRWN